MPSPYYPFMLLYFPLEPKKQRSKKKKIITPDLRLAPDGSRWRSRSIIFSRSVPEFPSKFPKKTSNLISKVVKSLWLIVAFLQDLWVDYRLLPKLSSTALPTWSRAQFFSRARGTIGRFFMFSAAKREREMRSEGLWESPSSTVLSTLPDGISGSAD